MKRYNEFTEEEIEDLARECDCMAEENSRMHDLNAELLAALIRIRDQADREYHPLEIRGIVRLSAIQLAILA